MRKLLQTLVLAALPAVIPGMVNAQTYPEKQIKLIVPYPPGASTDALGRTVAQKISAAMGQTVVVDNRAGASGNIGSEITAKSAPDGYTFLLGTDATHASNMNLVPNPPFHPVRDFTPLSLAAFNPIVLVVHPSIAANTIRELVALVKANPGKGSYGTSGSGSPHHLSGELLKQRSGAPFTHIPYRGGAPALNDVMGGQIPMLFASAITVLPHIQAGRVKAIAVTGSQRYEGLPQVPTIAETYDGFDMPSWLAFFGPANMPEAVSRRLSEEINKALTEPETKSKLVSSGLIVMAGSSAELGATVRRDFELRGKIIREANIKAD
jgi:tripartite-type tricarboxylate transporter receptor subunit TctC